MKKADVIKKTADIATQMLSGSDVTLWDVEYQKEGASDVLRVLIDKEGGVNISDCENLSRAMDPVLDELDYIEASYSFEVSSAGLDRALKKPEHFSKVQGQKIDIKLFRPNDKGEKEFCALLIGSDAESFTVRHLNDTHIIPFKDAASVKLHVDF